MAVYFASDVHLGLEYKGQSARMIEDRFVDWLISIENNCQQLHLVGDVFDFWFEWKRVIPKGFVRTLGQLARMSDNGIDIFFYVGNHDLWQSDYLEREIGAIVMHNPTRLNIQGKTVTIAHGDNLGKRDLAGKVLSATFRSRTARWIFSRFVHPNLAMNFGLRWSSSSRHGRGEVVHHFSGEDENIVNYARNCEQCDYFVFGHLHTPVIYSLNEKSKVVVLGEWIVSPTYAKMENGIIELIKLK